jgi:2-haloacid dehalogenase
MQMTAKTFSSVRSVFFDAYGTLFDVHAPVARVAGRIGDKADALSRLWRQKQLEYTWLRSLMGTHADFWQVTGDALPIKPCAATLCSSISASMPMTMPAWRSPA